MVENIVENSGVLGHAGLSETDTFKGLSSC